MQMFNRKTVPTVQVVNGPRKVAIQVNAVTTRPLVWRMPFHFNAVVGGIRKLHISGFTRWCPKTDGFGNIRIANTPKRLNINGVEGVCPQMPNGKMGTVGVVNEVVIPIIDKRNPVLACTTKGF